MADSELIRKIKDSVDIVDIIGEHVNLKPAGSSLKGLSPFNSEKTPSFFVRPDRQTFSCFSSNNYGDVVDFVRLVRGFSFQEALVWLADKGGVTIPGGAIQARDLNPGRRKEFEVYNKLNRYVAHFFQAQFRSDGGAKARKYASERGISEKMIQEYGIGFAPDSWSSLRDYLLGIKAPMEVAMRLGVLKTKADEKSRVNSANVYDAFRNRLMFPIRDTLGEIVGFGGRILDGGDKIKYLNSPESPVYNKGRILFNLDRAKRHIRETETVILVEGYMDCLAIDQVGHPNVVANLGTALTNEHVRLLLKVAKRVVVIYDSDSAGKAATLRIMDLFLQEAGFPVSGVVLPSGKDPDEFIKAHSGTAKAELHRLIHDAPAVIDTWIQAVAEDAPKSLQGKMSALSLISQKVARLSDPIWVRGRVNYVANLLALEEKLVLDAFLHEKRQAVPAGKRSEPERSANHKKSLKSNTYQGGTNDFEEQFLEKFIADSSAIERVRGWCSKTQSDILQFFESPKIREIMQYLLRPLDVQASETNDERIMNLPNTIVLSEGTRTRATVFKALTLDTDEKLSHENSIIWDALKKVRANYYDRQIKALRTSLKEAEARGDESSSILLQRDMDLIVKTSKTPLEIIDGR